MPLSSKQVLISPALIQETLKKLLEKENFKKMEETFLAESSWPEVEEIDKDLTGDQLYKKAKKYYQQKDYKQACLYWKKAALKNDARAYQALKNLYIKGKGVEVDPEMAARYRSCYAKNFFGRVKKRLKEDSLEKADQLDIAIRKLDLGDYEGAEKANDDFWKGKDLQSHQERELGFKISYYLALHYHKMGEFLKAMNFYRHATTVLIPKSDSAKEFQSAALANMAVISFCFNLFKVSIENCLKYFDSFPSSNAIYQSESEPERIINLDVLLKLIVVKSVDEEFKKNELNETKVRDFLEELADRDSDNHHLHFLLALLYWKNKDIGLAEDYFNQCLQGENHEHTILAWQGRGELRLLRGDFKGALEDAQHILNVDVNNAFAYALRADVELELGDYEKAEQDFKTSLTLKIENTIFITNRYDTNEMIKYYQDILKYFKGSEAEEADVLNRLVVAYHVLLGHQKETLSLDIGTELMEQFRAHLQLEQSILDLPVESFKTYESTIDQWRKRDRSFRKDYPNQFSAYEDFAQFQRALSVVLQRLIKLHVVNSRKLQEEYKELKEKFLGDPNFISSKVQPGSVSGPYFFSQSRSASVSSSPSHSYCSSSEEEEGAVLVSSRDSNPSGQFTCV